MKFKMMRARLRQVAPVALGLGILSVGCGGGGGGSSPSAPSLSLSSAAASVPESASVATVQVVLSSPAGPTEEVITVDVMDLGTGTGTAGADYAAFGTQSFSFPIGSVDGAARNVTLSIVDDLRVEGASETARLQLQNASGAPISGTALFTATIVDDDVARIEFAVSQSATPDESAAAHQVTITLDLPAGGSLDITAQATLSDQGSGSATSGADYQAFAPLSVIFAAGSADGAVQSGTLMVSADTEIEANETVVFALANPSAGSEVGGLLTHLVTITDDDGVSAPAFAGSEGASGIENLLTDGEAINLGTESVGSVSNPGTLIRVSNNGDLGMALGPPILSGGNSDDFQIEIEQASIDLENAALPMNYVHDMYTPFTRQALDVGPGVAVSLDEFGRQELHAFSSARLLGFPVPGHGDVTLELERLRLPIEEGAVLLVDGVPLEGGLRRATENLTVWSGTIPEIPDSRVFLSFSAAGPTGFIELPTEGNHFIHLYTEEPASASAPATIRMVAEEEFLALGGVRPPALCDGQRTVIGAPAESLEVAAMPDSGTLGLTVSNCVLAIETDYQLYEKFGSVQATTDYVTQLIATVSQQYFIDVQTTLSISYLAVYSNAGDPWVAQDSGGDAGDVLDEFRAAWAFGGWPAQANLAHFISGANLGGGVAYVNVLCNSFFGFGVSGNINGIVDWGSWSGNPGSFTWDFVVVAHELGHNFGSSHTQDYCPPIDHCYSNCEGTTYCSQGTLMSYCHSCGGMDNIDLRFHQITANVMRQRVESSCLGSATLAGGDFVQYLVRFKPVGATGARATDLIFEHDAPNAPQPFSVQLQGTSQ